MSHLQPIQHSLDPADGHLDNVIFSQITLNDGNDESPGLQPPLETTMTDKQSTLVKTLCRCGLHMRVTNLHINIQVL
ncbi:unnamed protein product [Clavelina lepadiformis]|uniref:Uncharacterized protein n=1 Tax=Clavelina lepadiformis TaxID=159417 RepID=A0ABP0GG87_CLALP